MKKLENALLKRALGYTCEEVVEEYGHTDDGFSLTKKKVTKKHVPPDLAAIKAYIEMEGSEDDFSSMSVAELKEERKRLLAELDKNTEKERNDGSKDSRKKGKM